MTFRVTQPWGHADESGVSRTCMFMYEVACVTYLTLRQTQGEIDAIHNNKQWIREQRQVSAQ